MTVAVLDTPSALDNITCARSDTRMVLPFCQTTFLRACSFDVYLAPIVTHIALLGDPSAKTALRSAPLTPVGERSGLDHWGDDDRLPITNVNWTYARKAWISTVRPSAHESRDPPVLAMARCRSNDSTQTPAAIHFLTRPSLVFSCPSFLASSVSVFSLRLRPSCTVRRGTCPTSHVTWF